MDTLQLALWCAVNRSLHSAEALQKAAIEALAEAKSQESAADALADAEWSG